MPKLQHPLQERATSQNRPKNRFRSARQFSLETLETKRLLAFSAPEVIIADDAPALTAATEAPGFRAVMVRPSGEVVATGSFKGSQGDDFTLVQYRADGTLDPAFSSDGVVQTNFSTSGKPKARHDTLWGAGMDSQGRIVVSGSDNRGNLVVARFTSNGTLDNTFSGDGYDKPGSSASLDASMQTIAFDAADNVYIAGEWLDQDFRVVKYSASGILDVGFGVNGVFTRRVEERVVGSGDGPNNRTVNIAVYESALGVENILLSGTVNTQDVNGDPTRMAAVLRLNLDGSLDSTFDVDGIVTTNVPYNGDPTHNNYGSGIATDAFDRILISGISSQGMNVIRYNSDGSLDTSFNASGLGSDMPGVAVINSPSEVPLTTVTRGRDLVLDALGRIVVGGTYKQTPNSGVADGDSFVVARLTPDGTLDFGFGTGGSGVFELLVGGGANELTDITIAPNGDIWASGLACADPSGCDSYGSGQPFDSVLLRLSAPVASNVPPTAVVGGPYTGGEDVSMVFDATASSDPDGDSLTYTWDFGDGSVVTTSDPTPAHTYQWGGNFDVTLTVDDGRGGTDTATTTANVGEVNDVPIADVGGPYSGEPSIVIAFDASASSDFDNLDGSLGNDQTLSYIWDFGDSSTLSTTTPTVNHTYATEGTYPVTLTVNDGVADSAIALTTATVATAPVSQDVLLLSLRNSQTIDGVSVANEDILAFNGSGFEMRFDGSDVGLGSLRIDAFAFLSDMEIVMSFDEPGSVPGLGTVDDSDLVKFTATQLGESTAGSFSLYFDGSDVGLTTNGEDIDGLEILPDGTLLISTNGSPKVPGVNGRDEDILAFSPSQVGASTSGVWSMYFDGSDVGLSSSSSEDVNAIALAASGALRLSTTGNFGVSGQSGEDDDVFTFNPTSTGGNTSGSFDPDLFFDGNQWGLSSNDIYGLEIDWV